MRRKLPAVIVVALVLVPGVARANGPSGSKEDKKTHQVKCAQGTQTPIGWVYAETNGFEMCNDGNDAPDGRVIVSFDTTMLRR